MAETATFAVVLEDKTSGAASSAAASLQAMKGAVEGSAEKVKALQTAMRNLKGPGVENTAQWKELTQQLTAAKAELQKSTSNFLSAGGSFEKIAKPLQSASGGLQLFNENTGMLSENVKKVLGPLGEKGDKLMALKSLLGTSGAVAVGFAAAVAVVAVAVIGAAIAVGKLVYAMAEYALTVGSAAMKQQGIWEAMTGSTAAAGEVAAAVAKISKEVPNASAEVAKLATDLAKSGKRGKELEDALFKASMKAAGYGDKVKRGSDVARKAMLPVDVQLVKLKDNFANIFKGVKIDSFLSGMADVLDVFDESTASGQALKTIVESMLNPLFDAAAKAGPYIKQFFKGMVVGALLVAIAVVHVRDVLTDAFGGASIEGLNGMKIALYAGVAAAIALAIGLGVLAVAIGVIAAILGVAAVAVALFMVPFAIGFGVILVAVLAVVAVFALLGYAVYKAYNFVASLDFGAIGQSLMDGLVNGITSGAGAVMDAIRALASSMKDAIKGALGIASPSKVFAELGSFTAEGFAVGVDAEAPAVADSLSAMVEPPAVKDMTAAGESAAGGGAGGTRAVNITIPLQLTGMSKAEEDHARGFVERICEAFEDGLEQAGIPATVSVQ